MRRERGTPHSEPFAESSARIFAESNRYSAISEPFDESSARIFVRGVSRTGDTSRTKHETSPKCRPLLRRC